MSNYNKVLLMGRLTRDPELRYTPQGVPVTDIGLAINREYTAGDEHGFPSSDRSSSKEMSPSRSATPTGGGNSHDTSLTSSRTEGSGTGGHGLMIFRYSTSAHRSGSDTSVPHVCPAFELPGAVVSKRKLPDDVNPTFSGSNWPLPRRNSLGLWFGGRSRS